MKKIIHIIIVNICILVLTMSTGIFFPRTTFAIEATRDTVSVRISPEFPRFSDVVTITLSSYATDLKRATVSWKEEGTTMDSGIGNLSYTTKAPSTSGTKKIEATIRLVSGETIIKYIGISPADVDILIESIDSYTPPFYKGRSLPVREGLIKVSAIPQMSGTSDTSNFVYTWKQNFKSRSDFSGYGKRYFVYKNAFLDAMDTVEVVASTQSGSGASTNTKTISLYTPTIVLYEDHPSEGLLLGKALTGTFAMKKNEITVVAIPFFMSASVYGDALSDNLSYEWKINGSTTSPSEKNKITLRRPEDGSGTAELSVSVTTKTHLFQKVDSTSVDISF